jgi:hypothetical protein
MGVDDALLVVVELLAAVAVIIYVVSGNKLFTIVTVGVVEVIDAVIVVDVSVVLLYMPPYLFVTVSGL